MQRRPANDRTAVARRALELPASGQFWGGGGRAMAVRVAPNTARTTNKRIVDFLLIFLFCVTEFLNATDRTGKLCSLRSQAAFVPNRTKRQSVRFQVFYFQWFTLDSRSHIHPKTNAKKNEEWKIFQQLKCVETRMTEAARLTKKLAD